MLVTVDGRIFGIVVITGAASSIGLLTQFMVVEWSIRLCYLLHTSKMFIESLQMAQYLATGTFTGKVDHRSHSLQAVSEVYFGEFN